MKTTVAPWPEALPSFDVEAAKGALFDDSRQLSNHFLEFVDSQVASGRYGSASEVIRAGLRLLETQEQQVRALQEALKAGEDSGAAVPFDGESFLQRMREKHVG